MPSDRGRRSRRLPRHRAGRAEVSAWFTTPVPRTQPPRDELAIKLALAVTVPGVDVGTRDPAAAHRHDGGAAGLHPAQAAGRRRGAGGHAPTWPGGWCSTRWSSPPRPRSAGSTTARPGCAARPPRAGPRRRVGERRPTRRPSSRDGEPADERRARSSTTVTRVHGEGATEVHALRAVSFAAYAGELVAVMGPSGSGKSTLLTLAGGLDTPTAGTVSDRGRRPRRRSATRAARGMRRTSIGYVFQDFNLIPALTAAENVALPRELDGERTRAARQAGARPRSRRSGSASSPTGSPTRCRAASSSGSRSPAPSSASAG